MRHVLIAASVLAGACCIAQAGAVGASGRNGGDPLADREAGAPQSCVQLRTLRGNRPGPDGAILFEGPGDMLYLNRPAGGCPWLDAGRTLIIRSATGQLCRGDIVTVRDPVSGIDYGSCGLGDFTPYRRVRN